MLTTVLDFGRTAMKEEDGGYVLGVVTEFRELFVVSVTAFTTGIILLNVQPSPRSTTGLIRIPLQSTSPRHWTKVQWLTSTPGPIIP